MSKTIKKIEARDGSLYVIKGGNRLPLATFNGFVAIKERQRSVPILGRLQKGVKSIYASFVICNDYEFEPGRDFDDILSGCVYEAVALIGQEKVLLAGLKFEDSDPLNNILTFEVTDLELIKKLAQ